MTATGWACQFRARPANGRNRPKADPEVFAAGTLITGPRIDPSEPNSGTRLLPWVSDGKAHTG